jgi:hypothetical protein
MHFAIIEIWQFQRGDTATPNIQNQMPPKKSRSLLQEVIKLGTPCAPHSTLPAAPLPQMPLTEQTQERRRPRDTSDVANPTPPAIGASPVQASAEYICVHCPFRNASMHALNTHLTTCTQRPRGQRGVPTNGALSSFRDEVAKANGFATMAEALRKRRRSSQTEEGRGRIMAQRAVLLEKESRWVGDAVEAHRILTSIRPRYRSGSQNSAPCETVVRDGTPPTGEGETAA